MAEPKAIQIYLDSYRQISMLDNDRAGQLLKGLLQYALTGARPDYNDDEVLLILSAGFEQQIARDFQRYDDKCKKNRLAGLKSASARNANKRQQTLTSVNESNQEKEEKKEKEKEEKQENNTYTSASADKPAPMDYQSVVDSYNSICKSLPKVHKLTDTRRRKIKTVIKQLDDESIESLFEKVEASDFLTGRSGKDWKADFDFIMRPDKAVKIMEGSYDNRYSADDTSQLYQNEDRETELALQRIAFGDIIDEGGKSYV